MGTINDVFINNSLNELKWVEKVEFEMKKSRQDETQENAGRNLEIL